MNDLKNGSLVVIDENPYQVLSAKHTHKGRGGSNVQARLRNLINSQVLERNFKQADVFEEAEIAKTKAVFLYTHRGEFFFSDLNNTKNRFILKEEVIGDLKNFLKPSLEITAIKFNDQIINIELPVIVDYKVIEAPPSLRGNTAQGGSKIITIETGVRISAPLFISEGDVIKINTERGEYIKRV